MARGVGGGITPRAPDQPLWLPPPDPISFSFASLLSLGPTTAFLVIHFLPPWDLPVDLRQFPLWLTVTKGLLQGTRALRLTGHLAQRE